MIIIILLWIVAQNLDCCNPHQPELLAYPDTVLYLKREEKDEVNRQESRDLTRQKLRISAAQIFAREGIGAASIDRIAEQAGYSRGAFYSNYADKHSLALELLDEWQTRELAVWTAELIRLDNSDDRIEALRQSFNQFHANGDRSLLSIELQLEAERRPVFGEKYNEYLERLHGGIAELLTVLFARAGRCPPTDIMFIARTMRAMTVGLAVEAHGADALGTDKDPGGMLALFLRSVLNSGVPCNEKSGELK